MSDVVTTSAPLQLNDNNLYRTAIIVNFPVEGEQALIRTKFQTVGTTNDIWHPVKMTDRIDLIAYKYYSTIVEDSSKYWWLIADANNIQNPLDLSSYVGTQILVPDLHNALLSV